MSRTEQFKRNRRAVATLPGGTDIEFNKPCMSLAFTIPLLAEDGSPACHDENGQPVWTLHPATITAQQAARGKDVPDKDYRERYALIQEQHSDLFDLIRILIVQAAREPRVFFARADAEEADGLCIWDFNPDDLTACMDKLSGLMGVSSRQLVEAAPFRESPDAGPISGPLECAAIEPA